MRKQILCLLAAAILLCFPFTAGAERNKYLGVALSFLEEGNPFLKHYNEINETEITPVCPLGCPYFWGGRHVVSLLKPYSPNSSSDYYKRDRKYLYGLDCTGFIRYIQEKTGYEPQAKTSDLLKAGQYTEYARNAANKAFGAERAQALRIGDLVAIQHPSGGYHIAMYCGTLSFYGYTEENVPRELIPYLEYPLIIHSTGSSDYYLRYKAYLEEMDEEEIIPPYGGVIISILDVPSSAATAETPDEIGLGQPCFDLEGYHLQITDLSQEKRFRWIRWRLKAE